MLYYGHHRDLHSFPTRRSSDLNKVTNDLIIQRPIPPSLGFTENPWANVGRVSNRGIEATVRADRKSTRLNSSHSQISYAVFCLKKKKKQLCETERYYMRKHGGC